MIVVRIIKKKWGDENICGGFSWTYLKNTKFLEFFEKKSIFSLSSQAMQYIQRQIWNAPFEKPMQDLVYL